MVKFLFAVAVFLLYGLANLLGSNLLYGAIVVRARDYGVREADVVALVATNLALVLGVIVVVTLLYFIAFRFHAEKALAGSSGRRVVQKGSSSPPGRLRGLEVPLIVVAALAVAVPVTLYWQVYYGIYASRTVTPPFPLTLSPAETQGARVSLKNISYGLGYIRQGIDKWQDLSENWAYQIQTNGPDDFAKGVGDTYSIIGFAGFLGMSNATVGMDMKKYPDIAEFIKNDSPDCIGKPLAFSNELKRIKEHKGADVAFTLINNTKMADWLAALPECKKWIGNKIGAFEKIEAKYN
jgi:hypothetical protein